MESPSSEQWDQHFAGVVLEVAENSFTTQLVDITYNNPDELAEFRMDIVNAADRGMVVPGALFDWYIRLDPPVNRIVFLRYRFSQQEVDAAWRKVEHLQAILGGEGGGEERDA